MCGLVPGAPLTGLTIDNELYVLAARQRPNSISLLDFADNQRAVFKIEIPAETEKRGNALLMKVRYFRLQISRVF